MQEKTEQLYNLIEDIQDKNDFDLEIKKIQDKYGFLFDEYTAALLIVDKLGRNKQNISKISELEINQECTVYGTITRINKIKHFTRKNGSNGRVVNIEICDNTGSCNLVLWGKNTELVENKKIKVGSNLKVINAYTKNGFHGLEINMGRWGIVEIEPEDMPTIKKTTSKNKKIKGKIDEITPTYSFIRDSGEFGFLTEIRIKEGAVKHKILIWDEKVKEVQKLNIGDEILIENIDVRKKNGSEEFHVNGKGIIKKS